MIPYLPSSTVKCLCHSCQTLGSQKWTQSKKIVLSNLTFFDWIKFKTSQKSTFKLKNLLIWTPNLNNLLRPNKSKKTSRMWELVILFQKVSPPVVSSDASKRQLHTNLVQDNQFVHHRDSPATLMGSNESYNNPNSILNHRSLGLKNSHEIPSKPPRSSLQDRHLINKVLN